MTFDFEEKTGDLFENITPKMSVFIGVCEDMKTSNKAFKQKIASQLALAEKKPVGQVAHTLHGQRHFFFLVTRSKSYNKPSYQDLGQCLEELRKQCRELNILNLAFPRDFDSGFQEKQVKDILFKVFSDWPGKLVMYTEKK